MNDTPLRIGGLELSSRLIVGTGKYATMAQADAAIRASGTRMVTVALRRVNLTDRSEGSLFDLLQRGGYHVLPNTAGCYTVDDAVRTAMLAREIGLGSLCKVEVIGDPKTLFPDPIGTLEASRVLVNEGFTVLPYCTDDPVLCQRLRDVGCAAVMPLAAPIGSGLGIRNPTNLRIIREQITEVPLIVDAGVGTASDAAVAMELGFDGVLMNTAIAGAADPIGMATAMRLGVEAGRLAFLSGRIPRRLYASASSPLDGLLA